MARVAMFVYVLLAGLTTPALLFAAGGEGTPPPTGTGAQATDSSTPTTPPATTTPAPPPAPSAEPAAAPAPTPAAPAVQAAPAAPASPARAHPTSRLATQKAVKVRAVARAAGGDTISDFKFTPSTITVTAGESVTWTNSGPSGHSATADDGSFDTGVLGKGSSGSHTFTRAGTYTFHCTPHPFMTGKVVVVAASGGGSSASGSATGSGSSAGTGTGASSSGSGSSATGTDASSGSNLANTGADVGAVALLGAMLIGGGMVLRRRVADDA